METSTVNPTPEILLYSGGMDSYIAWWELGHPKTLYVDLQHKYAEKELLAVKATIPETKRIQFPLGTYEHHDAYIPFRNLHLCTLAANEGATKIWLIVQKDEMSLPDRSQEFMSKASQLLSLLSSRTSIEIATPFDLIDKTQMVHYYKQIGGPIDQLLKTVGCYDSELGHCGNCNACFRRYIALANNDIDPGYELSSGIKAYYRAHLDCYSTERQDRMRPWLTT